ncbi:MAG: Hsp20/alpha crystallin family protein [Alphaproteobacteria bacterium]|nr:Hsp20/alpha crystallin family protein [Alphaproteobacteria bacterium]
MNLIKLKNENFPYVYFPSILDQFWNESPQKSFHQFPAANIKENEKNFTISLAVPGLKKEDIKISLNGNVLSISAQKTDETKETKENYTRSEYNYSQFNRSFTLPNQILSDKIEANLEHGELHLSIPKKAEESKSCCEIAIK